MIWRIRPISAGSLLAFFRAFSAFFAVLAFSFATLAAAFGLLAPFLALLAGASAIATHFQLLTLLCRCLTPPEHQPAKHCGFGVPGCTAGLHDRRSVRAVRSSHQRNQSRLPHSPAQQTPPVAPHARPADVAAMAAGTG